MGHGTMAGHGFFLGAAAFGVALTLITEGLSLGHHLTPAWLAASWALTGGIGLWALRGRRLGERAARATPMPRVVTGAVGAILAVTGAIAVLAPPNTWDSMTYHMPRVAHWSQAGSVAHYPTHVLRQLWLGPWAEFAIAHLYLLAGGDRLVNLVQWLAFAACVAGATIVAGELGGGPRARAMAAIACATLPMAIAQASSTQNDLVASFWMLALGYWVLRFRAAPGMSTAVLVGISAGLAGLTKLPVWFLAVPWLLAFTAAAGRLGRRRAICCTVAAGLSAVALNAGHVSRTVPLLEREGPSSPWASPRASPRGGEASHLRLPPVWTMYVNTTVDPRALASNVLRNAALHVGTPSARANACLEDVVVSAHRAMGFDPNDVRTTFGPEFRVRPFRLHEDFVGNPLHLLAGLMVVVIVWRGREAFGAPVDLDDGRERDHVLRGSEVAAVEQPAAPAAVRSRRSSHRCCPRRPAPPRGRVGHGLRPAGAAEPRRDVAARAPRAQERAGDAAAGSAVPQPPHAAARLRGRRGRPEHDGVHAGGAGPRRGRLGVPLLAAPPGATRGRDADGARAGP